MMDDGMEDVDGDVLAGLSSVPPRRKIQSFSQQLGSNSGGDRTHRYHHPHSRRSRKHSLEENRFPNSTIDHFLDSSDDEFFSSSPGYFTTTTTTTSAVVSTRQQKQQEYTTAFLDRKPSSSSSSSTSTTTTTTTTDDQRHHQVPIPEFVASGGSKGIFKVPNRRAMHPNRPPSIELRPHPLRETQLGSFLRVIACTDSHLWAGQESGLRYWNFSDAYAIPFPTTTLRAGDDAAAPFHDSTPTSPTLCLILDMANRLVWTGHQDGKIKMWNMDQTQHPFKEILTWRALRGPILSLAISSYGDLWSGSEGGMIKVWPWETIEKSFSLTENERHMASLLVERSYVDLRSVNGVSSMSSSDVKYLLSDNSRAKVWSAGNLSFALWDARTRDLLKMFNMEGQIENRIDIAPGQDPPVEEEMKVKLVSTSKKDKPQNSLSFLQRSRNALMGAADAVRRAATKGTFGEENRRTEALVLTADGMIWTGCTNGLLLQWDGNGNRLQDFKHHHSSVQCLCTFGARIWVGYVTGTVQVLDLDGNLLGGWVAHDSPIIKLAVGAGYVFTLANHGGIRGWNITSPGPLDNILRSEVARQQLLYTKLENLKILIGTWNVGQGRASHDSLILWLGSAASDVGLVVVGLQEVEMGAGFLAMSAARESVGLEGSSIGQWWLDTIGKNLDEGTTFERIGSRQLAGLLIAAWVRKNLRPYVGDVDAAAVPCGLGRAIGNKGAVGLRIRVYDRIMCFVNCHLAAHLEAINRRNADFDHIFRNMMFNRPNLLNAAADSVSSGTQMLRSTNTVGIHSEDGKPELSEADMVVFLGDFNYRLYGITYEEAKDFVSQRCFDWLRERDQLRAEMKSGKVFQGMREGVVTFPPTYKFEKHQPGLGGYDSSEKKRIPAWCDRIVYRDSRSSSVSECSLDCPVVSSILQYEACMDVTDSDHKPVRCILNFDIACIDEPIRRREFGEAIVSDGKIRSLLEELHEVPETSVDTNNLILQNQDQSILRISNKCDKDKAFFQIICESESTVKEVGQASEDCPRGSFGFPRWLEVTPAVGVIRPGQATEVLVNYEVHTLEEFVDGIPQNWWCEDTRDKEVILVLSVRGSLSTATRCHKIHVRHHFEPNNNKSKCNNSTRTQRSNANGNSSSDADSRHAMIHFL